MALSEGDDQSLTGSSNTDVPDVVGKIVKLNPRTVDLARCHPEVKDPSELHKNCFFATTAFQAGPLGQFGNSSRQFFYGPGFNNTDFGLAKRTTITESMALEIRAEFFNIFNHTQFTNPVGNITNPQFGQVTSTRDPRIGQVSAKFTF